MNLHFPLLVSSLFHEFVILGGQSSAAVLTADFLAVSWDSKTTNIKGGQKYCTKGAVKLIIS